jgi:SAM-dependent methyltransferase
VPHLRLRQVAELVRRLKPTSVLDLGCATGHLRNLCPGIEYVGCDFVAPPVPPPFPFYQCDFNREALPADLQELELIVCSGLLEYIEDLPKFVGQLRSRLDVGGYLIATYFNMNHISRVWAMIRGKTFPVRPDWHGFYSPSDLAHTFSDAGFELTDRFAMQHAIGPSPAVCETVDTQLSFHPARAWSTLFAHQFIFVAKARPWNDVPVEQITSSVPVGARFILVDDAQWSNATFDGRHVVPFLEKDGQYWGHPKDGAHAIREFERLRQQKAEFIIFASPAFWWLDYYCEFARYLDCHFTCKLRNESLIVFDIRKSQHTAP